MHLNNSIFTFVMEVLREIDNMTLNFRSDMTNLNQYQRRAIKELMDLPNVIIKPSDKGGNVVLMNTDQYKRICTNILQNDSWYRFI